VPIDTRDKRASCLMIGLPFGRVAPMPDGSITPADFEQESLLYRGVPSGGGPALPEIIDTDLATFWVFAVRPPRPDYFNAGRDPSVIARIGERIISGFPPPPLGRGEATDEDIWNRMLMEGRPAPPPFAK
jgi:hypothetical protein